jgi:hypothetical protein
MRERSSSTLSTRCAGRNDEVACVDLLDEQLGLDDFDHAPLDRLVARPCNQDRAAAFAAGLLPGAVPRYPG